ncbi:hypothetical protein CFREI_12980 [Corynebacterium freiburgense]|nr:hypothetical protein CFREI_12980 [Corynebacterium freiburgense]
MRFPAQLTLIIPILLPCVLLFPLILPGQLIHRDMVVLDNLALSLGAFGFGDLPARNAPQDGALALLGKIVPASWVARAAIFGAAIWACWSFRTHPAAALILLVNPFIIERLLQGHWSLVIAAWLLPIVATPTFGIRRYIAMWVCALTPTGVVAAVAVALTTRTDRLRLCGFGLACALPWIIPSLMHSHTTVGGAHMFAARAETYVGTLGALLGLGGIWNAQAVPPSRHMGFALAGVALFILLISAFRHVPHSLLTLAGVGFCLASLGWLTPGILEYILQFPGGGLLRDGQKWVILAIPAMVFLAQYARPTWLLVSLTLLQIPDAPAALWQIKPTNVIIKSYGEGQDVLFTDLPPTLDPRTKASPSVESGALKVDGLLIDAPSARYTKAMQAWRDGDISELQSLQVGVVVDGDSITKIPDVTPRRGWPWWMGLGLSLGWLLLPIISLLPALWRAKNKRSGLME